MEKPHNGKSCKDILDKSMEEFSKNNFIKKCPHCGIITEKAEGCNHITCSKCNYQWCWLCNGKYTTEHFREGKCRGFQFFKPKNENDIKLAFEGKINLNQSQQQHDLEENYNRTRRIIRMEREEFDEFHPRRRPFRPLQSQRGIRSKILFYIFRLIKMIKIIIIFIIYFLFGNLLILISFFKNLFMYNTNIRKLSTYFCVSSIILILFPIIFIQIIINFILFIPYIIILGFKDFFDDFFDIILLKNDYNKFEDLMEGFLCIIYSLFGAEIFLTIYNYYKIRNGFGKKFYISTYYFIAFLHIIIYFPKYIIFDSIGIISKCILVKGRLIQG